MEEENGRNRAPNKERRQVRHFIKLTDVASDNHHRTREKELIPNAVEVAFG
jgi:hypothetical protein